MVGGYVYVGMALWSRPAKPLPRGTVLAEARAGASGEVARLFEDIDRYCAEAGIRYYETGMVDYCIRGKHNWKTDANCENRCRYQTIKYYGLSGDFGDAMRGLDSALLTAGWTGRGSGLEWILTDYCGPHYGPDKPKPTNFPRQYLVQNMPGASYTRGNFRLTIRAQEADSTGREFVLRFEDVMAMPHDLSHRNERVVATDSLVPVILASHRYMLVIGVMADDYFVN